MIPTIFSLNKEDEEHKDLIFKNLFFLHTLLPNQVNVFPLKEITEDILNYIKDHARTLIYLIYPVYKHSWYQKDLYIEEDDEYFNIICSSSTESKNKSFEYFDSRKDENDLNALVKNIKNITILDNKFVILESFNKKMKLTFEAYGLLYLMLTKEISINDSTNYYFITGLVEAAMNLGIMSIPIKQTSKPIKTFYNFHFTKIPLKSLYISNQVRLFEIWKNKEDTLLTGGTGIGKTSQVPKLFWWFNFLYDGYMHDIEFNMENFKFVYGPDIEIEKRVTVLSLPRKILINENSLSIAKSIGFNEVIGSPINCKYKDVKDTEYYNPTSSKFISSFLCSVNRSTTYEKVNTIIFDEIHEHDTFCDIGISIIRKLKEKFRIRNLILITATIVDDLPILQKFIPNIKHIHIKGETLFPITEYDMSLTCNKNNDYKDIEKIIKEYSIEKSKSTIIFFSSASQLDKMKLRLEDKKNGMNKTLYKIIILSRHTLLLDPFLIKKTQVKDKHVIILSTPIAESSITIPNAKVVIDTGLFYCKQFFGGRTISITQSMLEQRKGRIGRVSPGTYIKLFKEVNNTFKKIDYEFLFPYILNVYYYGLSFDDLFIQPTKKERFNLTLKYFKERKLDIKKDYKKIMALFNRNVVALDEYYIILMKGTLAQKAFIHSLDKISLQDIDLFIRNNQTIVSTIVRQINIQCDVKMDNNRVERCALTNYFENMPSFVVRRLRGLDLKKTYLFSPDLTLV